MIVLLVTGLWVVSLGGLLAAAVTDCRRRIIPNRLVLLTAACGVAVGVLLWPRAAMLSIAVALATLLVLGLLAQRRLIGGGDAKLTAAVTLLLPPNDVMELLAAIVLCGGLVSVVYLLAHLFVRRRGPASLPLRAAMTRIAARKSVPYGVAILGGATYCASTRAVQWLYATS
jgi:prepilin peptidase CpaA